SGVMPRSVVGGPCGSLVCYRTAGRRRLRRADRERGRRGLVNPVPRGGSGRMSGRNVRGVPGGAMAVGWEFLERRGAVAAGPADRLADVARDSGLSLAVATGERVDELRRLGVQVLEDLTPRPPFPRRKGEKEARGLSPLSLRGRGLGEGFPDRLAYAIYTSGS